MVDGSHSDEKSNRLRQTLSDNSAGSATAIAIASLPS